MRTWLFTLAIALPLFAQTDTELRTVFDAYNRALRGEMYNATMAILTDDLVHLYAQVPPSQRKVFFGMTYRIPDSYQVEYVKVSKNGLKASMLILCSYSAGDKSEMTLNFINQQHLWKMERPVYVGDPAQRARPANLAMGSRADYAGTADAKLRGTLLRLNKEDAGTVYVIRNGAEEDAVFVPKAHVSDDFVPGAVISFQAAKNKSEKMKYWAESATLVE